MSWNKRNRVAQMAFPTIAILIPHITKTKEQGFLHRAFYRLMPFLVVGSPKRKGNGSTRSFEVNREKEDNFNKKNPEIFEMQSHI